MLDQNTDRMWFVIGALVVGAGIILLANKAMPEMMAKVRDSSTSMVDNADSSIRELFGLSGGSNANTNVNWTYLTSNEIQKDPAKDRGGVGHVDPANVYFFNSGVDAPANTGIGIVINQNAPTLDNVTGSVRSPVPGYGVYESSIKVPEQHGLLNGFFIYTEDDNDNPFEVDMEILYYQGKWQLWTTVFNPTNANYVYGAYLNGNTSIEAEPGVIFQKQIDLSAMGVDPTSGYHNYRFDIEEDVISFYLDDKRVSQWNGAIDYTNAHTSEIMLSSFWTHWLVNEKAAQTGSDGGWYEEMNAKYIRYGAIE